MAGLIKMALALHHRVLPPTLHAASPHPLLDRPDSPFALNPRARPWVHGDSSHPRRAGVNAFGHGGFLAHAVLEEHAGSADGAASPGALTTWDSEAILLAAPDRSGLIERARRLLAWLQGNKNSRLKDIAATINTAGDLGQSARLGLVATSPTDLAGRLEAALDRLGDGGCRSIRDARGTYFWDRDADAGPPRLAFLFPGEGSQYPGMLADLCPHFPEVRALFDTSDRIARAAGADRWPSESLFGAENPGAAGLWSAGVAANVVLSAQWALYQLLIRLGLRPDAVVGHSSGEVLALAAAGAVAVDATFEDRLGELGALFGGLETTGNLPTARLVAVAAARDRVESLLAEFGGGGVVVAMDNCPHQVVIAGLPEATDAVVDRLRATGVVCEVLPFDRSYHTASFAPALGPIAAFFDGLSLTSPLVPLYSCATATRMPDDPAAIRRLAVAQWTRPVRFRETITKMHADGLRVFVDVGARGNLAGFVEDTLRGRPAFTVAANLPRRSGLTQINHLVASLFAQGIDLDPTHLYARRRPVRLDFVAPSEPVRSAPVLSVGFPTMHLSDGMLDRLRSPLSGRNGSTGPRFEVEKRQAITDPPLANFQKTMDAFRDAQEIILDAYQDVRNEKQTQWWDVAEKNGWHSPDHIRFEPGPWAGELVAFEPGRQADSRVWIAIEGDPVAEHHTLGGRRISASRPDWRGLPVLPFSVMAEMLAEAAARLAPGRTLQALREVRAHRWIRYEDEPVALDIRATVDSQKSDAVKVTITNRGTKRAGRATEAPVFEGVVVFGPCRPEPPVAPRFSLTDARPCRFTPGSIYAEQWLFHGPALRAIVGIGSVAANGIEGTLRVRPLGPLLRDGRGSDRLLTDPIILDNFTHLLGAWGLDWLADDGDVIFPLGMESLTLHGDRPADGTDVACRITVTERERHRVRVDADLVLPDGRVWMAIQGWQDWRFRWPGRFRDGFRQPDQTTLGERLDLPGVPSKAVAAVWLEPPADMGRPIWRDVLEHVQLGPDERAAMLALPGPDARRTDRLWGRIAAKEAARRIWLDGNQATVYPADLLIEHDARGRPLIRLRTHSAGVEPPRISIAHVEGVAVALAATGPAAAWVGIDVEAIVERSAGFEALAFSAGERALLDAQPRAARAEWVARFWTAKEAVAKATGFGFLDGPTGVEVVAIRAEGAVGARLRGGLAAACPELAHRLIQVVTARREAFAWAWTLGEGMIES